MITLDADGQHLPREIPKFLAAHARDAARTSSSADARISSARCSRAAASPTAFPRGASPAPSRTNVTDSQSGFRLYSARLLRSVRLRTDGFDLESEVIVRAGCRGFKVITIPIDLGFVDGLSTSHYKPLGDTLRIAWTVFRARFFWR